MVWLVYENKVVNFKLGSVAIKKVASRTFPYLNVQK